MRSQIVLSCKYIVCQQKTVYVSCKTLTESVMYILFVNLERKNEEGNILKKQKMENELEQLAFIAATLTKMATITTTGVCIVPVL